MLVECCAGWELEPELEPDADELPVPELVPDPELEDPLELGAVRPGDVVDTAAVVVTVDVVVKVDAVGKWDDPPAGGPPMDSLDDFAGVVVGEEISVAGAELSAATLSFAATFRPRPLICEMPGGGAIDDEGVIEQQLCSTIPRGAETPATLEPRPSFCSVKASSFPVTSSPLAD
ncbi:MAG TPA: hypothetical protein VNE63_10340 [Candidatus Acidoferrales bacterium]|nr:hypothetical protein [Candidatus Acidoferrales bacterium]